MNTDWQLTKLASALESIADLMDDLNTTIKSIDDNLDGMLYNIKDIGTTLENIEERLPDEK